MAQQKIDINITFPVAAEAVFSEISDHVKFGKVIGANIKRVKDGQDNVNGKGSIRRINMGPLPAFEETVTDFSENQLIEYTISKGPTPIKNHLGRLVFTENGGETHLNYTIVMESKIPFTGGIIKNALETGLIKGLKKLRRRLAA